MWEDILEAISYQRQPISLSKPQQIPIFDLPIAPVQEVKNGEKFAKKSPNLTACQQQIYQHISLEPIAIDDLAKAAEMNVEQLLVELLGMELQGDIKQVSGGYVLA